VLGLDNHPSQRKVGLTRALGLGSQPCPRHLDFTVSHVQGNVSLAHMPDPRRLDLVVSQVQGNVGLTHMLGPRRLDLTGSQV